MGMEPLPPDGGSAQGLRRYIQGSLVRNGKPQGFRSWQGGRQYLFCVVDAVHIFRIYMRRIYVSPAHRLIFLRCQLCVE